MHLAVVAEKPRPVGSDQNRIVREFVVETMSQLNWEVAVQSTTVVKHQWNDSLASGSVHNVIATRPGADEGCPVVLVVGHYDSVPTGPGASDNGSAVASMLEVARALSSIELDE